MLGVGIGEVVVPQLVKKNGMPLPVAAGTSVLVVFLNAVGESVEQVAAISHDLYSSSFVKGLKTTSAF